MYYTCNARASNSLKFHVYFCGMAGKTDTRVARSYTFTLDSEQEKADLLAYAKERGLTLAGLIKMLLAAELEKNPPKSAKPTP